MSNAGTPVRTRFAPSPTGFFHIGGARTALFNWLYARHTSGKFILRIEDTDSARNSEEFLRVICDSLKWLGMDWDEGPGVGGPFGPYSQSQRGHIYHEYCETLRGAGRTYMKDGAIWFRLIGERHCVHEKYSEDDGTEHDRLVERVKAPPVLIRDVIRGDVSRAEDRDFVLVRANGEPGFHFVNVVDDISMQITHVIRGEDHLSNTSKHIELYNALGVPAPVFAHIPLILKADGRGKMSKRDRGALIEEYQARHFLPEAVRNFLCLLGWTPKDGREILPINDVITQFELHDVHQANARFDERKMAFFNQQYLRALPPETFAQKATPVLRKANILPSAASAQGGGEDLQLPGASSDGATTADDGRLQPVLALLQEKVSSLENIAPMAAYFFSEEYPFAPEVRELLAKKGDPAVRVRELLTAFGQLPNMDDAAVIDAAINATAIASNAKPGDYFAPLRYAVSGLGSGPHLHDVLRILGKERVIARMTRFQ